MTAEFSDGTAAGQLKIAVPGKDVAVTGVSLNRKSAVLYIGDSLELEAAITPADATDQRISWSSSDPAIATVDRNGVVKGIKAGAAEITATTRDGKHQAYCEITVKKKTTAPARTTTTRTRTVRTGGAKTGDQSNWWFWGMLLVISLAAAGTLTISRRRRSKD